MKAIILAAGYATRLYPLTENMPKALLPVGGKTIIDHLMDKLMRIPEIDEIHIVSNHRFFETLTDWANKAADRLAPKRIFVWDGMTSSTDTRLGAVGDIRFAIKSANIDDDILIAASDNLMDKPLDGFLDDFRAHGNDLLLAGKLPDINECRRYAVLELDNENRVIGLTEKPEQPKTDIVAYALYLYRRDTLPLITEYLDNGNDPDAPGHFPEWLYKRKDVRAYIYDGECVDIGTLKMYKETCEAWERA